MPFKRKPYKEKTEDKNVTENNQPLYLSLPISRPDRLWGPPVGTMGSFPGGKAARKWSWLLTSSI
jgi:hypothetical protein